MTQERRRQLIPYYTMDFPSEYYHKKIDHDTPSLDTSYSVKDCVVKKSSAEVSSSAGEAAAAAAALCCLVLNLLLSSLLILRIAEGLN